MSESEHGCANINYHIGSRLENIRPRCPGSSTTTGAHPQAKPIQPPPISAAAATIPNRARFTCTPEPLWVVEGPIWCKEVRRVRLTAIAARIMDGRCADGARDLLPTRWRSAIAERLGPIDHPAHGGTADDAAVSMKPVFLSDGPGHAGRDMAQLPGQPNTACSSKG